MKTSDTPVDQQLADLAPYVPGHYICVVCETYTCGVVSGQLFKIAPDHIEVVSGADGRIVRLADIMSLHHDAVRPARNLIPA